MSRRLVLTLTAAAVLATGAGVASAATTSSSTNGVATSKAHQLCLLLYRDDPQQPQHICINW